MSSYHSLISQLSQAVSDLQHRYDKQRHQFVQAKFAPTVFSENYQPVNFYLKQINQTLAQLQALSEQDNQQIAFFTEKLLAQCTALSDALTIKTDSKKSQKPKLSARELRRQQIEMLPPRERLAEYYNALNALNEKLNMQKDQYGQCQTSEQQVQWKQRISHTQQRRQACLDAIEVLEEYLAFKQAQEQNDKE